MEQENTTLDLEDGQGQDPHEPWEIIIFTIQKNYGPDHLTKDLKDVDPVEDWKPQANQDVVCQHYVEHYVQKYVDVMSASCWIDVNIMLNLCQNYAEHMITLCWTYVNTMLMLCQHCADIMSSFGWVYAETMNLCQWYVETM